MQVYISHQNACSDHDKSDTCCIQGISEGAVPSQGVVPSQFAIVNVAAIKQVLKLVAGSACGRSSHCLVAVIQSPAHYCFRSQSQQKRAAL